MKHIKVGAQNDRLFVKSRFMYLSIVIYVMVKKNTPIIDNVTRREMFFMFFWPVQCKFHTNISKLVLKMIVSMRRIDLYIFE